MVFAGLIAGVSIAENNTSLSTSSQYTLIAMAVALGIACIISFIIGFVFCIKALVHHDKHKISAIIGVVIGAITLLPVVIDLLAVLFRL